jgi:hypothetical protein
VASDEWEALSRNVRGHILDKLPLRELASAAPTCREFQRAFLRRMQEERARVTSAGETTYGKRAFLGLVQGLQRLMRNPHAFPDLRRQNANVLVITPDGQAEITTWKELRTREDAERHLTITREYDGASFVVQLWRRLPESGDVAGVRFDTEEKFEGGMEWRVYATGSKEANEAAISLMLALHVDTLDAIRAA